MTAELVGRASLKPRPGSEGMTRWKGWWSASSGSVKSLTTCPRERLGKGNGGINNKGIASARGERAWMNWILIGDSD